jgi:hypothetical protein
MITWKKENRICGKCGSNRYHIDRFSGNTICQSCGACKVISYKRIYDLGVNKKTASLTLKFREENDIDKTFGIRVFSDCGEKYVDFKKESGIMPSRHPKLAYTIHCKEFCDVIGIGKFLLIKRNDKFQVIKIEQ